ALGTALEEELQKPFREIKLQQITAELNEIMHHNKDHRLQVEKAEALVKKMQETYLEKSVAYKDTAPTKTLVDTGEEDSDEEDVFTDKATAKVVTFTAKNALPCSENEKLLVQAALDKGSVQNIDQFYAKEKAVSLHGIVKPYARPVKNVPGDFILVNPKTNLPLAYLYSTKVDLNSLVGKEVSLSLVERPNNNFAYPAYFVLKAE
ncbi:MAG: hypothetical protein JWO53_1058, partial [Chlamydiia bacterium]|nr:hypothetical protein [Chlamydiia bacterium]